VECVECDWLAVDRSIGRSIDLIGRVGRPMPVSVRAWICGCVGPDYRRPFNRHRPNDRVEPLAAISHLPMPCHPQPNHTHAIEAECPYT
jgi:hypothetical protein